LRAQDAAAHLAQLTTAQKNAILLAMADAITANAATIMQANQQDLDSSGLAGAMRDRLLLNSERIASLVAGVRGGQPS
jgi:glutamate-5-semialdehyde dehydrogenase